MNKQKKWKAQGSYEALGLQGTKKGTKMILTLDKETGATTLIPINYTERTKGFFVENGRENEEGFKNAIYRREMLGDKLEDNK